MATPYIQFCLLILLLAVAPCAAMAAPLLPTDLQPLYRHLAEVNGQWSWASQYADADIAAQPIRFATDADRIKAHLLTTEQILSQQPVASLDATQRIRRQQCLTILHSYALAGQFPQNTRHDYRAPYFIDYQGVACAVGYLLIETGFGEIARQISREKNNAYLCELLAYQEVVCWAADYGFAPDELALIQPTYAPVGEYLLYTDGDGTDGTIYAMHTTSDNTLLLGGSFATAGGVVCHNIASRSPSGFSALGNGVNGTVRSIATHGGSIYVGGLFSNGATLTANLARWNGMSWAYSNIGDGTAVLALYVHSGSLYAGGSFGVQKRTTSWIAAGGSFNGIVHTLSSHNGFLIAGGEFTQIGNTPIMRVAVWSNNSWQSIGSGLDAPVYALQTLEGELYAGGKFFNGTQAGFGLARWNNVGNQWQTLIYAPYYASGSNKGAIYALQSYGNRLLISGDFWLNEGKHLTFYDPNSTDTNNLPPVNHFYGANDAIYAAAIWGEDLYVGGAISDVWTYAGDFIDARNLMRSNIAAVQVPISLQLQGAYDATTGQMKTTLAQYNLLPTQQPFGGAPWQYDGEEAVANNTQIPINAVDWVLVEARSATNSDVVIDRRAAWLLADGTVADITGDNAVHFYRLQRRTAYIFSVRHRNHLAVLRTVANVVPSVNSVAFNQPDLVLGGSSQLVLMPTGNYALCAGDFNADGVITVADFNDFDGQLSAINQYLSCDADLNRTVTTGDFNLYMSNTSRIGVSQIRY